ncbi:MAG: RICIN domain-containing protein [Ruthenibacterium sp.]
MFTHNKYYEIKCAANDKFINLYGDHENGVVNNGNIVNLYSRTNNKDQRWALERFGSDYNVRIVCERGDAWYALNYNTQNASCIVWHLDSAANEDTVIQMQPTQSMSSMYYMKLLGRDLYLTAVGDTLKWTNNPRSYAQMFSLVEPGSSSGTGSKRLSMPVNINQKAYSEPVKSKGCALCCGVDVSSYYGSSANNNVSYFLNTYWSNSTGYSWGSPNAVMTESTYSLSTIKSEISAGRPVVVHGKGGGTEHWVVAFAYDNDAASPANVYVLDPYQGVERTLNEAMRATCGENYIFDGRIKKTRAK